MGFDPRLGAVFNFTADDLEHNRAGVLSPDQETMRRNTVHAYGRQSRRGGVLLATAVTAAAIVVAVGIAATPGGDATGGIVAAVILIGIVLLAGAFRRRHRCTTAALAVGELAASEGPFSWDSDLSGRWWGRVGDAPRFSIFREHEELLTTGARYRLHYLATGDSAWVLSIERAANGEAAPE